MFEHIDSPADVIKLAGRGGDFDLAAEFGVDPERLAAFGRDTQLAVAAGIDALRDAGLPLAQRYKTTTTGGQLPERWALPEEVADETGVIFASAFPGLDAFADDMNRFWQDRSRRDEVASLEHLRARLAELDGEDSLSVAEVDRCIHDLRLLLEEHAYTFDRRFLFRILSMGHCPVRRAGRCARPQHPGQCRLCQHHPGPGPRRGLDPGRPMPSRRDRRGRRRDLRSSARVDRGRIPRLRRGGHRRGRGRGGAAVRPATARDDPRHGRRRPGGRVGAPRRASVASGPSARCSAR